ncbi:hypothetical protein FPRO04_04948 [Fusarium proliferatum]|nr:hypothetical protein FPRO04_04948 [Fusarium proliferatum]
MTKQNPGENNGLLNPDNDVRRAIVDDATRGSKTDDWKVSLIAGASACIAVLIVNLGVTIWSTLTLEGNQDDKKTSRRIIYEGSCSKTRELSIAIHLVINIFGSILLAASNYVFSSLPLHLLFNSVVFSSLTTYDYEVFTVDKKLRLLSKRGGEFFADSYDLNRFKSRNMNTSKLDNLTALECINEYGVAFLTRRSDLLVVVDTSQSGVSKRALDAQPAALHNVRRATCPEVDYDWICPEVSCDVPCRLQLPQVRRQSDNWRPWDNRVEYCLSQPAPQRCRLNFDVYLAAIILGVNFIKAITLAFIALRPPKEPLFILGDAIQSFLTVPDENSRGNCLASARTARAGQFTRPCTMHTKRRRRGVAVTGRRWFFSFAMYGVAFGVSCFLLAWGIRELPGPHDIKSLWDLGFGAATELTIITGFGWEDEGDESLFWNVLVSNLPQLVFSLLYFQYNGLFTCMAVAKEWSDFGRKRNPLRVSSNPRGQQRSRYFLQLPYRFSIPLLLVSILMHWMLSQSIFIVAVETRDIMRPDYWDWSLLTCGYSPIAIIFVIVTSIFMAAAMMITACRRLPTAMPVAASCSLAISAACHQPDGIPSPEASLFPLQWGVMWCQREGFSRELTDHCGFSHHAVEVPQDGRLYF